MDEYTERGWVIVRRDGRMMGTSFHRRRSDAISWITGYEYNANEYITREREWRQLKRRFGLTPQRATRTVRLDTAAREEE